MQIAFPIFILTLSLTISNAFLHDAGSISRHSFSESSHEDLFTSDSDPKYTSNSFDLSLDWSNYSSVETSGFVSSRIIDHFESDDKNGVDLSTYKFSKSLSDQLDTDYFSPRIFDELSLTQDEISTDSQKHRNLQEAPQDASPTPPAQQKQQENEQFNHEINSNPKSDPINNGMIRQYDNGLPSGRGEGAEPFLGVNAPSRESKKENDDLNKKSEGNDQKKGN